MINTNEPSAAALIRAQGQQIRRETAWEYLQRRCGLRGDADGQEKTQPVTATEERAGADRQKTGQAVLGKVVGSSKDFPYTEVRMTVQMDEPKEADEISKQMRIRKQRREQVESLITEIEQFIAEIPDSRDRQIFE